MCPVYPYTRYETARLRECASGLLKKEIFRNLFSIFVIANVSVVYSRVWGHKNVKNSEFSKNKNFMAFLSLGHPDFVTSASLMYMYYEIMSVLD